MTVQRWGALASFTLAVAFIVPPLLYLVGDLRDALWQIGYDVADLLYGPLWAASLVTVVSVLREQIGERAPRRMTLALLAAAISAAAFVAVATMRVTNRDYFQSKEMVSGFDPVFRSVSLVVPGVIGAGRHFLGWTLLLIGSAGWTTRQSPRLLNALALIAGVLALFIYRFPPLDEAVVPLSMVWVIWQGILFLRAKPAEPPAEPEKEAAQPA